MKRENLSSVFLCVPLFYPLWLCVKAFDFSSFGFDKRSVTGSVVIHARVDE